jgi:aspartyl-tRNA(Asn)/glutamyl-tRNA(Gln) amidotransferase subunit A
MTGVTFAPAWELAAQVRAGTLSPVELVDHFLGRIERLNPKLKAFITVAADHARAAARRAETDIARGRDVPPLCGIPLAVKDTLFTKGIRTTGGSLIYEEFVPDHDAIVVERLVHAGAIVIGKTTTPEFAMGAGLSYNRILDDDCHNPWDLERSASASSAGSAVAVAAGLAPLAIGSDAGGSIRLPAAWCGVYGLKPTKGRVPAFGDFESFPLFGVIGPLTRTVRDAALLLQLMSGYDRRDVFALREGPLDLSAALDAPLGPLRVAWSPDLGQPHVDPALTNVAHAAAMIFESLGCHVEEIAPAVGDLREAWLPIAGAELFAGHIEDLAHHAPLLTPVLRTILEEGSRVSGAEYAKALWNVHRIRAEMERVFSEYDILLTPTTPVGPVRISEILSNYSWPGDRLTGVVRFTSLANITGGPSASVPCGFTPDGLPVGLQLTGRWGEDAKLLRVSAALEQTLPWRDRVPTAVAEA